MDSQDIFAFAFFLICWAGYARYAMSYTAYNKSLLRITNSYRLKWMHTMLKRDQRSVDAIMVGNLQRSITFFANTTIFILIGLMTMLGYHEQATPIIKNIPFSKANTPFMWQCKVWLLIILFIYAFFKYTWSLRQYNYASIFIVSCPEYNQQLEEHDKLANKGAHLIGNAARHFDYGIRAYYFGLGALAWFIHPYLFMAATAFVVCVAYRRDFRSATLKNLAE